MANKKYEEADIQAIATTIREKTGTDKLYNTREMASGVSEVYEAGIKSFWDTYLELMRNGFEVPYLFSGASWNSKTFYPTEDIVPKKASHYLFQNFSWWTAPYIDLAQRLEECRVVLDTSQCTGFALSFANCFVTRLPKIDVRSATSLDRTFQGDRVLETIDELALKDDGTNTFSNTFQTDISLSNIKISGVIGRSVSFADCPLTVESMKSIITHLKDYSGTTSELTYSLTLSSASKLALEAEGATSPNGNLWSEYVDDLGWTLR